MACEACERAAKAKAADPEMYRGESPLCSTHQRINRLREALSDLIDACSDQCGKGYCVLDDHDFQESLEKAKATLENR